MIATPHDHLTTIITGWNDLARLVTTRTPRTDRLAYVREIEAADAAEIAERKKAHALARADMRDVLGDRPVPLSLHVLDTITAIESALLALTDHIASTVQRPAMSHAPVTIYRPGTPDHPDWTPDTGWTRDDTRRRNLMADADAYDVRRWTYTGQRTAPWAAEWLRDRLAAQPGPFLPLPDAHRALIGKVARGAAERMERILGTYRVHAPMDRACPWCAGELTMHSGGDDLPTVTCDTGESCTAPVMLAAGRREWRGPVELAALQGALDAAGRRAWERDRKRAQRAGAAA